MVCVQALCTATECRQTVHFQIVAGTAVTGTKEKSSTVINNYFKRAFSLICFLLPFGTNLVLALQCGVIY